MRIESPEAVRAMQESAFDGFRTGEHIVYHRPIPESSTLLTWAASPTERTTVSRRKSPWDSATPNPRLGTRNWDEEAHCWAHSAKMWLPEPPR